MKVEFDDWRTTCTGSAFVLEMDCAPVVGQEIWIWKGFLPNHYWEDSYAEDPPEELDGLVKAVVRIIEHKITTEGHLVKVCVDI